MLEICFTRRRVCHANRVQSFSIYLKYYFKHLQKLNIRTARGILITILKYHVVLGK